MRRGLNRRGTDSEKRTDGVYAVGCRDGNLLIEELQRQGKKAVPATNKVYDMENPEVLSAQRGFLLIGHIFQHTVFINGRPVKIYDCVYAHNLTLSEG